MAAGQGTVEYVGKIQLDASELMRVLGLAGGGGGGGGAAAGAGGPASGADLKAQENIKKGMGKAHKDPSFMSIFKPLVALEGIKALVSNSRVANAYLGGMGKMFSAAIDLLLLPFTPIFNLLMVGLSKLIGWLIDSGVLEWVAEGVQKLVDLFGGFFGWVKTMFTDPVEGFKQAIRWLWEQIKNFFKDPMGSLGNIAQLAVAGAGIIGGAAMMPLIGGPIRGAIGAALGGIGGMLGLRGGARAAGGAAQAAGGAARGGFMGGMGLRFGGGAALLGGGMLAGNLLGRQGGAVGTAGRIGGMGLMGAGIGTMVAPGLGTAVGGAAGLGVGAIDQALLGGKIGKFLGMGGGGGGGQRGKVAENIKNIGTQNITMNIYVQDKEMAKEIIEKADEQMTASAEAGG